MSAFEVVLSFRGKTHCLTDVTTETTAAELYRAASEAFPSLPSSDAGFLRILHRGKVLSPESEEPVFATASGGVPGRTPPPKLIVMASSAETLRELSAKRSDPTMRGFDQEEEELLERERRASRSSSPCWGPDHAAQDRNYKFIRLEPCTRQSFGHGATDEAPHAFEARRMLEKLATDPGVRAIMTERRLVVNTLGEMDPIDDRLMQKTEAGNSSINSGRPSCRLLGYNTNRGLRIDVRLRTRDLKGFLPYPAVVSTLIHELSHNWVSEHDLLFWTNYGHMRAEYLHRHASLQASGYVVMGKSSAAVAGVSGQCAAGMAGIAEAVLRELTRDMAQHGLSPAPIAPAIIERCRELTEKSQGSEQGRTVGSRNNSGSGASRNNYLSPRDAALQAAERRRRAAAQQQNKKKEQEEDKA